MNPEGSCCLSGSVTVTLTQTSGSLRDLGDLYLDNRVGVLWPRWMEWLPFCQRYLSHCSIYSVHTPCMAITTCQAQSPSAFTATLRGRYCYCQCVGGKAEGPCPRLHSYTQWSGGSAWTVCARPCVTLLQKHSGLRWQKSMRCLQTSVWAPLGLHVKARPQEPGYCSVCLQHSSL